MTGRAHFRHLLKVSDLDPQEIHDIFELTEKVRRDPEDFGERLSRKTVGLLFEKASTRTRLSFEAGVHQMGGDTVFMGGDSQLSRGETIEDLLGFEIADLKEVTHMGSPRHVPTPESAEKILLATDRKSSVSS